MALSVQVVKTKSAVANNVVSHTVSSVSGGDGDYLVVSVATRTQVAISSVTYGSTALTLIGGASDTDRAVAVYALASPATSESVTVTLAAAQSAGVACHVLKHVDPGSPFGALVTVNDGSATSVMASVAPNHRGLAIDIAAIASDDVVATAGMSQTESMNAGVGGIGATGLNAASSYQSGGGTMSWSWTGGSRQVTYAILPVNPIPTAVLRARDRRWAPMMRQSVQVEPLIGLDVFSQPIYGPPTAYRGRLVSGNHVVINSQGVEVASSLSAYVLTDDVIAPDSRVTLSTGDVGSTESFDVNPPIKNLSRFPDSRGRFLYTRLFF